MGKTHYQTVDGKYHYDDIKDKAMIE